MTKTKKIYFVYFMNFALKIYFNDIYNYYELEHFFILKLAFSSIYPYKFRNVKFVNILN